MEMVRNGEERRKKSRGNEQRYHETNEKVPFNQ